MKLSGCSILNPKRLFVPVNEFEFNTFVVRIRRLASRASRAPEDALTPERPATYPFQKPSPRFFKPASG
jgi:hypothetical protein